MKKYFHAILFVTFILLLIGCNNLSNNDDEKKEDVKTETEASINNPQESEKAFDEKTNNDNVDNSFDSDALIQGLELPKEAIENLYDADNNFPTHTEAEIVTEFMDDDGRIYFSLNEHPVRNITSADGKINNITNYSDQLINVVDEIAYMFPEKDMAILHDSIITIPAEMLGEIEDSEEREYRSLAEATNLEKGIISSIGLTGPLLNELDRIIFYEAYDSKLYDHIINEFSELGNPSLLIPAPQTSLDMELFNNMLMIKELWARLGKFTDADQDLDGFIETYELLRQETNNLLVRTNFALSEK